MPQQRRRARRVRDGAGVVQICSFGLITPDKGIERALRALSTLKPDHTFHYTLVGAPNSFFDVSALVRRYGLDDRVTITGHVSLAEFERRIAGADIALTCAAHVGETSGTSADYGRGVPSLFPTSACSQNSPRASSVAMDASPPRGRHAFKN